MICWWGSNAFRERASVLPTSSIVGLSMPFDKGFRFDSAEQRGLRSLLLSFRCLSSARQVRDPSTTLPLLRKLPYSSAKVQPQWVTLSPIQRSSSRLFLDVLYREDTFPPFRPDLRDPCPNVRWMVFSVRRDPSCHEGSAIRFAGTPRIPCTHNMLQWLITDDVWNMEVSDYLYTLTGAGLVGIESSRNIYVPTLINN